MKAKVKATGEIVEVIFNSPYYDTTDGKERYYHHELDFQDTLDYWTRLEHQYAGMAMQGILGNPAFPKHSQEGYYKKNVVNNAYEYAHALVEKYKKEEKYGNMA